MDVSELVPGRGILYAIINSGLYISYNNGDSWMRSSGTDNIYFGSISVLDTSLYVGTNGVSLSENYGSSFISVSNNLPENSVVRPILATDSVIVAAVNASSPISIRNIYISDNKGISWDASEGISDEIINCIKSEGKFLFAGTRSGVYVSGNYGRNWTGIGPGRATIQAIEAKDNWIYAGESLSGGYLYATADFGETWDTLNNSGLSTYYFSSIEKINGKLLVGSPTDGIFLSDDYGLSWRRVFYEQGISINAIAEIGNDILAGTDKGFLVSRNGGESWEHKTRCYNFGVKSLGISGSNLLAVTSRGVFRTSDDGLTWDEKLISMNVVKTVGSLVYTGGDNGFYRSTDYGNTLSWYGIMGLPENCKITDIDGHGSLVMASIYGHGVFSSNDYGINWSPKNLRLTDYKLSAITIRDSTVFVGSESSGIFRSNDLAKRWAPASNGLKDLNIRCLAHYKDKIYAGTNSQGIFISDDNGENWVHMENEFSEKKVLCLQTFGENIFAGIEGMGFFLSPNSGTEWIPCNDGLLDYNITSIECDESTIYIGTRGGAIWKRELDELPISAVPTGIGSTCLNERVLFMYPNPASKIVYVEIPDRISGVTTLTIVNMLGQEVFREILNDQLTMINLECFTPGLYIIRLDGALQIVNKMIVR